MKQTVAEQWAWITSYVVYGGDVKVEAELVHIGKRGDVIRGEKGYYASLGMVRKWGE